MDGAIAEKFRHLAGLPVYRIAGGDLPLVGDILKQKMQGRFVPCTQTAHWDIFRRQTLAVPACR